MEDDERPFIKLSRIIFQIYYVLYIVDNNNEQFSIPLLPQSVRDTKVSRVLGALPWRLGFKPVTGVKVSINVMFYRSDHYRMANLFLIPNGT